MSSKLIKTIAFLLMGTFAVLFLVFSMSEEEDDINAPISDEPVLELRNYNWEVNNNTVSLSGEIKNISDQDLDAIIMSLDSEYDEDGYIGLGLFNEHIEPYTLSPEDKTQFSFEFTVDDQDMLNALVKIKPELYLQGGGGLPYRKE